MGFTMCWYLAWDSGEVTVQPAVWRPFGVNANAVGGAEGVGGVAAHVEWHLGFPWVESYRVVGCKGSGRERGRLVRAQSGGFGGVPDIVFDILICAEIGLWW